MVFQEATSEAAGRAKKPAAQYLMPHNKHLGKQDCNCQFHDHKIFNPCKHRTVSIHLSVVVYVQCISASVIRCQFIYCYLSAVIHFLASCFDHIHYSARQKSWMVTQKLNEHDRKSLKNKT
jgi:hypothetical protein